MQEPNDYSFLLIGNHVYCCRAIVTTSDGYEITL